MFEQAISTETKSYLAAVGQSLLADQFYLSGGTAVALHLGHRFSYDLDFFCQEHFVIDTVLSTIRNLGRVEVFQATIDTFNGTLKERRFIVPNSHYNLKCI